jgi:hypothetical protein
LISFAAATYRAGVWLAGQDVTVVCVVRMALASKSPSSADGSTLVVPPWRRAGPAASRSARRTSSRCCGGRATTKRRGGRRSTPAFPHRIWMRLASLHQDEHPNQAIPIFQREVEELIGTKNNRGYADAVAMMAHVRTLLANAGRPEDFGPYTSGPRSSGGMSPIPEWSRLCGCGRVTGFSHSSELSTESLVDAVGR